MVHPMHHARRVPAHLKTSQYMYHRLGSCNQNYYYAMGWMIWFASWKEQDFTKHRLALEPSQSPIQWALGFSSTDKGLWHEVDHTPPSSAKVVRAWSCTSTPPTCPQSVDRDNFFFPQYIIYQIFVYLPPVFSTKGRMDETVGEQLSSLVNVSTCLHSVAQDFMYYSHITSFGFIVAWTQEWNMK